MREVSAIRGMSLFFLGLFQSSFSATKSPWHNETRWFQPSQNGTSFYRLDRTKASYNTEKNKNCLPNFWGKTKFRVHFLRLIFISMDACLVSSKFTGKFRIEPRKEQNLWLSIILIGEKGSLFIVCYNPHSNWEYSSLIYLKQQPGAPFFIAPFSIILSCGDSIFWPTSQVKTQFCE